MTLQSQGIVVDAGQPQAHEENNALGLLTESSRK